MNYIDAIFERADLNLITEFLMDGAVGIKDSRPYKERLDESEDVWVEYIESRDLTRREKSELTEEVLKYIGTVQSVYMEIGLQIGAKLAWKIYRNLEGEEYQNS